MGGLFSSVRKKDFTILEEKIRKLESRADENSEEMKTTNRRMEALAKSQSHIENTLGGLTTRLDDLGMHMINSNKRSEECLDILLKETTKHLEHRLHMERMIRDFGFQRNLTTKDEWIGTIPKDIYNTIVDEMRILHIKTCMSARHLKMVGRHLGLRDNDISEIEVDCKNQSAEVAYQILLKWKNRRGQQAKVKHLIAGFFQAAMEDPSSINVDSLRKGLLVCVK